MTKKHKNKLFKTEDSPLGEFWFRRNFDGKGEPNLEDSLGYTFKDANILAQALTHSSALNEDASHFECNERLEFLGDAVCNMLAVEYLYKTYPQASEGEMSEMKGAIVSGHAWAQTAEIWNLGKFIRVGKAVALHGGRYQENIVADAFEAVLGAVFLDGGIDEVRRIMETFHWPRIPQILSGTDFKNFKSLLLERLENAEFVSTHGHIHAEYRVVSESGPEHERIFDVETFLNGQSYGIGHGTSKKKAEQDASRVALEKLDAKDEIDVEEVENNRELNLNP